MSRMPEHRGQDREVSRSGTQAIWWRIYVIVSRLDRHGNDVTVVFMPPTNCRALRGLFGTSIRRSGDEIVRPAYLQ